jgi:hypothetical protein
MPIPFILAGFLAIAAPGQGALSLVPHEQTQSDQGNGTLDEQFDEQDNSAPDGAQQVQLTDTELFSAMAGNIVGAASSCREIDKQRVSGAADEVAALVTATSADPEEQALSKALFMHTVGNGIQAVQSGAVECDAVDASLAKLEQFAQRAADAANSGGSE